MNYYNSKWSTFKTAIAWLISIPMILGGAGMVESSLTAGLLMILIGVVLCPAVNKLFKKANILVSGKTRAFIIVALLVAFIAFAPKADPANIVKTDTSEAEASDSGKDVVQGEEDNIDREEASAIDNKIWDAVLKSEEANDKLLESSDAYDAGALDRASFYENCEIAERIHSDVYSYLSQIGFSNVNEYKNACQDYAMYSKGFAVNLKAYVNKGDLKKLTKAKQKLAAAQNAAVEISIKRMSFLEQCGFTPNEISEKLESENED